MRGQVAVPTQSSQGSQTAVGNGAQGNSTSAVPQASVGGVSGVPPIVAQVANALATNAPSQVSLSTETAADQGFHPTTDSRAVLNSSTPATTSLQNDPSG